MNSGFKVNRPNVNASNVEKQIDLLQRKFAALRARRLHTTSLIERDSQR